MIIIAFGNPLLDTTVHITNNSLLEKYNLKEDDQEEFDKNKIKLLLDDISQCDQIQSAGGCAQNTLRVLQWLLPDSQTFIFGGVGQDKEAITLRQLLERDGVNTRYIEHKTEQTGLTVALVKGSTRSLIAYIGAAEILTIANFNENDDFNSLMPKCNFIYFEGFFLTKRTVVSKFIIDKCNENKRNVIFNISGKYVCEKHPENVNYFVNNSSIIFGNKGEFESLRKIRNAKNEINIETMALNLVQNAIYKVKKYGKIVVVTDGAKEVTCFYGDRVIVKVPVEKVCANEIKDTTGAGDAFVSGFISGLLLNKNINECIKLGSYSASNIIKQTGCTIPNFKANIDLI